VRIVVQRVARAAARPGGAIGRGLLLLVGVADGDTEAEADRLAGRVGRLRIFAGDDGKFDLSLLDTGGAALVVSQFTLISDSRRQKGTRPDFSKAARPEVAEPLYEHFCQALRNLGVPVEIGVFGARMEVELVNDGPVTIVLDASAPSSAPTNPAIVQREQADANRAQLQIWPNGSTADVSNRRYGYVLRNHGQVTAHNVHVWLCDKNEQDLSIKRQAGFAVASDASVDNRGVIVPAEVEPKQVRFAYRWEDRAGHHKSLTSIQPTL
jgi:D-tyrosyl-tRNA(Tyr) deacylase